jgi:hypothetical protein
MFFCGLIFEYILTIEFYMLRIPTLLIIIFPFFIIFSHGSYAQQGNSPLIQLTGIIVSGDSAHGVPGAFVYNPRNGRGTSTNQIGFFSMPVKVGDSLLVKAIGFKQQSILVPYANEKLSIVITLLSDFNYLPLVEVFPWPTEKLFKEAFLSLNLDRTNRDYMAQNLNDIVMRRMLINQKDDGSLNHKYFINQQYLSIPGAAGAQSFRMFDPFAWKKFIDDSKKGGLKRQEERDRDRE